MKNNGSNIEQALSGRGLRSAQPMQAPRENVANEETDAAPGFEEVMEELMQMMRDGRVPEGFEIEAAAQDPAFADLITQYPADAAARIYMAERQAAEADEHARQKLSARMQSRRGLPKSQRGNAMAAPENDYANMSSEAFRALLASLKKTARDGGRTQL